MLDLVIASMFKEERRGELPRNSSKRSFSGTVQCAYCLQMYREPNSYIHPHR